MSDAAFRRSSSSPAALADPDVAQHFVPRASSLLGGDRMEGVKGERDAASSQMQRSLRAWRKAKEDDAKPAYIPESGGKPLGGDIRKRMEPKLGADLSGVRMYEGGESQQAAGKLGARAFTVGSDVHFNAGEFAPGTKEGDRLLAHELTHVVQGQKSGVQRKPEGGEEKGGEKGGAEVSDPAEPAEKEADAKGDEVAEDLHEGKEGGEKGGGKDDKKKDGKDKKKDGGKHAKDAANDEDEKKKGGEEGGAEAAGAEGGDKKGGDVKEGAPATAAKLYAKLFLKPKAPADPEAAKEAEVIKAWIEKEAAKIKTAWSAAAVPLGATLTKAGAAAGTLVAPGIGTAIGAACGAVAGALVSILGISKQKHHLMEEKAKLLDNIDALMQHPDVIHELYDYIEALNPDFKTIQNKIDDASAELTKSEKKKAEYDKKKKEKQDKKAGKTPDAESKLDKAGEKAHHGAEGVEKVEAGLEVGAAGAEAAGEASHIIATVAPVLEATAHVAAGVSVVLNTFVTAVDAKAWADKTKKYNELKDKMGGPAK